MDRRSFLELIAAAPLASSLHADAAVPSYRVCSAFPAAASAMPGPWPGRVVSVRSARCLDPGGVAVDAAVVREMMDRGMRALTGEPDAASAWRRFFEPADVVGVKVNAGGHPWVVSSHAVVGETVRRLIELGIPPANVVVFERFQNQLDAVDYRPVLPAGVEVLAAEKRNRCGDNLAYDPDTFVEVEFFGEDDTRSNLMRLVSRRLTKIVNIPNMKDHGASGVTGCLKNVAYGSFSNVARSHDKAVTHTRTFVGTLAAVEPLRSRTVLQVMDGLRGVWHGGPFARTPRYVFEPRQLLFGTDPVAIDRLLIDIIEEKRRAEGAISIWDRSPSSVRVNDTKARDADPNVNILVREPAHVEYAASLGLGVVDRSRIRVEETEV
ncbi:MAG TPA: DUF362 domain-containing protein [Vicinamibacteria bacterium]|nr:DUF362 domain-containing protein [Vicinamibacteria bacterium]